MDFLPSDIARLILAYLEKETYLGTFAKFLEECAHLSEIRNMLLKYPGRKIATGLMGLSLLDLLQEYSQCKTLVQSYFLDNAIELRPTDSLVSQLEHILSLKRKEADKRIGDAFAQAVSEAVSDAAPDPSPKKRSSSSVPFSKAKILHSKVLPVTRASVVKRLGPRQLRSIINEHKLKHLGSKKSLLKRRAKPATRLDVSVFYDQLLHNRTLHEKIADNINKAMQVEVPKASANEPVITDVIQTAIQQTESDPVFGNFLAELLDGFDTSVCTDMSAVSTQEQGSDESKTAELNSDSLNTPPCEKITESEPLQESHPVTFSISADKLSELSIVCSTAETSTFVPSVAPINTSQVTHHVTCESQQLPNATSQNVTITSEELVDLTLQNQSLVIIQPSLLSGMATATSIPQAVVTSELKKTVKQNPSGSNPAIKGNVMEPSRKRSRVSNVRSTVRKYVNIAPKIPPNASVIPLAKDDDLLPATTLATAFHSNIYLVGANAQMSFDPRELLSPAPASVVTEQSAAPETTAPSVSMPSLDGSPNIKRLVELSCIAAANLPVLPTQATVDAPNLVPTVKTPRSHVRALAFSPEKPTTPEAKTAEDQDKNSAKPVVAKKSEVARKPWDSVLRDSLLCSIPPFFQKSSENSEKASEPEPVVVREPKKSRATVRRPSKKTPKKKSSVADDPPALEPIAQLLAPSTRLQEVCSENAPELEPAVVPAPKKMCTSVKRMPTKTQKKNSNVTAKSACLDSIAEVPVSTTCSSQGESQKSPELEPSPVPEHKQIQNSDENLPKKTPVKTPEGTSEASSLESVAVVPVPSTSVCETAPHSVNEVHPALLSPVEQASTQLPCQAVGAMERFITATPMKTIDYSSNSTWMIPRTPEIRVHASNSMSPSLVSLTKGFQFLQPTVSPDRIVTPDILGMEPTPSTPNTPIFPRESALFLTPRVRSLQQEETSQLGTCDISPTQTVFRSSAYFVPSTDSEKKRRRNNNTAKAVTPEQNVTPSTRTRIGERQSTDKLICVSRSSPLVDKNFNGKNTVRKLYEDEAANKESEGVNALEAERRAPSVQVSETPLPETVAPSVQSSEALLPEAVAPKVSIVFANVMQDELRAESTENQRETEKLVDDSVDLTEGDEVREETREDRQLDLVKPAYVTLRKMPAMWDLELKKKGYVDLHLGYFSESSWVSGGESVWSPSESHISGDSNATNGLPLRQSLRSSERASTMSPDNPNVQSGKAAKTPTAKGRGKGSVKRGASALKCVVNRGRKPELAPKVTSDVENVIQEHLQQARLQIGLRKSPRNASEKCNKNGEQKVEMIICNSFSEENEDIATVDQAFITSVQKTFSVQSAVLLTLNIPPN